MMNKKKVLIVEDELLIAMDIKYLLEDSNIIAFVVKDYDSALYFLQYRKIDIVIIDVFLGKGKNGIDLGNYLSSNFKIPFIYLTSSSDTKIINEIVLTKANGFLCKPYKKVDLLTSVRLILNSDQNHYKLNYQLIDYSNVSFVIKKVLNFIDENIESKIEIQDLVKLTNWSKHHFIRIFTKQMGVSPYNYILKNKIECAKKLILEDKYKLENIAYDLGFQSYTNFARTFKIYTNLSPKQFKVLNTIMLD